MPIPYPRRPGPESQGSNVMKKLINSAETVVTEALEGVAAAHPSLSVDVENKVIVRVGGPTPGKVGLVSGGGSGHEPLHGGFVGYGMLALVAGHGTIMAEFFDSGQSRTLPWARGI